MTEDMMAIKFKAIAPKEMSRRGCRLAQMEGALYYEAWREQAVDAYDEKKNPNGVIQMILADNQLSLDLLEPWLSLAPSPSEVGLTEVPGPNLIEYSSYSENYGMHTFRESMAVLMNKLLEPALRPIGAEELVISNSATAALEMLAYTLADAGDAFIVPSPYYPGFDNDISGRAEVDLIPAPLTASDGFTITADALAHAKKKADGAGVNVKAVLISSPSNPLGRTLTVDELQTVLTFCRDEGLPLISDEIYAGSVYGDGEKFVSVLRLMEECDAENVHIIYGLAKDFGIPGFRVGALYTRNELLLASLQRVSRFHPVSSHTQLVLTRLLSSSSFVDHFLQESKHRLKARAMAAIAGLKEAEIDVAPANAGLFVWADFRKLLPESTKEGEAQLFQALLHSSRVSLLPAQSCGSAEWGWFRVCFAAIPIEELECGLKRLREFKWDQ